MKERFKHGARLAADKVKSVDRYSKTITFSFRGKERFGTLFGGLVSIATYLVLLLYAYSMLRIMFEKNDTTKNITTSFKDLSIDSDPLKLDSTSFMFGLSLTTGVDYQGVDDTYLTTSMRFVRDLYETDVIDIPFRYCNYSDFPQISQPQLDRIGITNSLCPDLSGVKLLGNYYHSKFNYIDVVIKRCIGTNSKGVACKNQKEIDEYVDNLAVIMFVCTAYFDFDDYSQPIKYFIDDQFYFELTSGFTKSNQIYVRENIVDDSNSIFQIQQSSNKTNFISVEHFDIFFRKEINNTVFRSAITKDSKSVSYQRSVLTFLDCCGFIGGVNEILNLFGMLIVSSISGKSFIYSILSKLYKVSNYEDQHKNFDSNQFEVFNENYSQQLNNQNDILVHPKNKDNQMFNKYYKYVDKSKAKQNVITQTIIEMK